MNQPLLISAAVLFGIFSARYLLIAGGAYVYFYVWKRDVREHRRIQADFPDRARIWSEIKYSFSSFAVFALIGIPVMIAQRNGLTQIYTRISDYGWAYFAFSVVAMILMHDAYFYWAHRFMHLRGIFQRVHKVHHNSVNPTPWASFSFHPTESVLETIIVPAFVFIMPVHPLALMLFLVFMTVMNVIGHLGYEIYPSGFTKSRWTLWNNTSTHHNMHHRYVNCNYGLYFNWWDRMMGTNHPKYHESFETAAGRPRIPESTAAADGSPGDARAGRAA